MEDATTFAFGLATPHAVLDAVEQRIFTALGLDRAVGAHTLRELDTDTVGGKEPTGVHVATASLKHPFVLVMTLFDRLHWLNPQSR